MSKKPIEKIKAGRGVTVAVWENVGENGTFHTFTVDRTYKKGEELKNTTGLRAGDLLAAADAMTRAHHWELEQGVPPKEEA